MHAPAIHVKSSCKTCLSIVNVNPDSFFKSSGERGCRMPGYKTHLSGGLIVFVCLLLVLNQYNPSPCTLLEWLAFTLAGSLFPDIDVKSKGQKWLYWFLFVLFICLFACKYYFVVSMLGIIALIPLLVNHRGLFHKPWFIVAVPASVVIAAYYTMPQYLTFVALDALFFCAGALSHLWLDLGLRRILRLR